MKHIFYIIFFFIGIFSYAMISTTNLEMVTEADLSPFQKWDIDNNAAHQAYYNQSYVEKVNKTFTITAHILIIDGDTTHTIEEIEDELVKVNESFAPTGMQFKICDYRYFHGHQYAEVTSYKPLDNSNEIVQKNYEKNTINMYFVGLLTIAPDDPVGGFAAQPTGKEEEKNSDIAFISDVVSMTHELGHFFGLYHTFETDFGVENADGSNCTTAGDLLCDTPAEPDLTGLVNADELYTGNDSVPPLKDGEGENFYPSVVNVMAYSTAGRYFSKMQIRKMILVYNEFKTHLR